MELFGAISDEMRLKILLLLDQSEFTVNEIKDILDIHQSNASRHLAKLSQCGLVKDRRDGIKAYYRLRTLHEQPPVADYPRSLR